MENLNVFVDKKEINELYNKEKYKNCMDKKYFEYIVSNGKIDYIDKYLGNSKNKNIVESLLLKNNTRCELVIDTALFPFLQYQTTSLSYCYLLLVQQPQEKYDKHLVFLD